MESWTSLYIEGAKEWLDERWDICTKLNNSHQDAFYEGAIKMCEKLGFSCKRGKNGLHTLIRK